MKVPSNEAVCRVPNAFDLFQRPMMKTSRPQIHRSHDSRTMLVWASQWRLWLADARGNKYEAWVAGMWGGSVGRSWDARLRSLISTDCLERSWGELQDSRKPYGGSRRASAEKVVFSGSRQVPFSHQSLALSLAFLQGW